MTIMAVMTTVVAITMVRMTVLILLVITTNKNDNGSNDGIGYDVMIDYGDAYMIILVQCDRHDVGTV